MKLKAAIAGLALVCLPTGPLLAQTMTAKFGTTSKWIRLHTAMPAGCDSALGRAAATWNAQPVNFNWIWDPVNSLWGDRWTSGNPEYIIEDGVTSSSTALASTYRTGSGTITQSHTIVKGEYLWYYGGESGGLFYCPATAGTTPSTQWDYQTTMTHELGHAFGMTDGGASTCVMYGTQGKGTAGQRRALCSTEATAFRNAYGPG